MFASCRATTSSKTSTSDDGRFRAEALAAALPPWSKPAAPVSLAAVMDLSRLPAPERRRALGAFAGRYCGVPLDAVDCGKYFLALRLLFELPRRAPRATAHGFGGWIHPETIDPRGTTFDVSWPVEVEVDAAAVTIHVAPSAGYLGGSYAAVAEYDDFAARYPLREAALLARARLEYR